MSTSPRIKLYLNHDSEPWLQDFDFIFGEQHHERMSENRTELAHIILEFAQHPLKTSPHHGTCTRENPNLSIFAVLMLAGPCNSTIGGIWNTADAIEFTDRSANLPDRTIVGLIICHIPRNSTLASCHHDIRTLYRVSEVLFEETVGLGKSTSSRSRLVLTPVLVPEFLINGKCMTAVAACLRRGQKDMMFHAEEHDRPHQQPD